MMKTRAGLVAALAISLNLSVAIGEPSVPDGYTIENYATGLGAATALALGPDGSLYITDYSRGQLWKRTTSGSLELVASGLPYSNAVAVLPSGRIFAGGGDFYIYEIVGGVPQLFASGFPYISSMTSKGNDLFVSSEAGISRISTATGEVTTELSGVINPFGLSFDALGNMYFISHSVGELYSYNFVDPPRRLAAVTPSGGTYTGVAFGGRLFWGDYRLGKLFTLNADGSPEVFAAGFVGANPPANGPNGIVGQGADVMFVADGPTVWRISRRPEADGVLQERSMQLSQRNDGGWVLRCTVQYSGVNGNHDHRVSLDVVGPGLSVAQVSAVVGPRNRAFVVQEADVQTVKIVLSPSKLWLERAVNLNAVPGRGDVYWCEASGQDTTSGGYLRTTHMEDISR